MIGESNLRCNQKSGFDFFLDATCKIWIVYRLTVSDLYDNGEWWSLENTVDTRTNTEDARHLIIETIKHASDRRREEIYPSYNEHVISPSNAANSGPSAPGRVGCHVYDHMVPTSESEQGHRLTLQCGVDELTLGAILPRDGLARFRVDQFNVYKASRHEVHALLIGVLRPYRQGNVANTHRFADRAAESILNSLPDEGITAAGFTSGDHILQAEGLGLYSLISAPVYQVEAI